MCIRDRPYILQRNHVQRMQYYLCSDTYWLHQCRILRIALYIATYAILSMQWYIRVASVPDSTYSPIYCNGITCNVCNIISVSYTHLDVYKRQHLCNACKILSKVFHLVPNEYSVNIVFCKCWKPCVEFFHLLWFGEFYFDFFVKFRPANISTGDSVPEQQRQGIIEDIWKKR